MYASMLVPGSEADIKAGWAHHGIGGGMAADVALQTLESGQFSWKDPPSARYAGEKKGKDGIAYRGLIETHLACVASV